MFSDPLNRDEWRRRPDTLRSELTGAWVLVLLLLAALLLRGQVSRADSIDEAAELTKAQLTTVVGEGSQCATSLASCPVMATCGTTPECTTFSGDFLLGAPVWREVWVAAQDTWHYEEIDALMRSATGQMLTYVLYTSSAVCGKVTCPSISNSGLVELCSHAWSTSECQSALGLQ